MVKFSQHFKKASHHIFGPPQEGQGLTEYALLLFFIAIVVMGILATIGPQIFSLVTNVVDYGLG